MAAYTQISKTEVENILQLYGKNSVSQFCPLSLGISNSNYKIDLHESSGPISFLLKISNDKSPQDLADEQHILNYLSMKGYSYSLNPIPLTNGDFIYHYGNFFGVLYPFIQATPPVPSLEICHQVGKALGRLHAIPVEKDVSSLRPHERVGYGPQEILDFIKSSSCPQDYQEAFFRFFPDSFERFFTEKFSKGIIHGDLYYDNTLFEDHFLRAVIDFEQSGIGEFIFDLGISISGTCLKESTISSSYLQAYLEGYESVRPLPENEKLFLNKSILLGLLSISLWRIKRFDEKGLEPSLKSSYQELLLRADRFYKSLN